MNRLVSQPENRRVLIVDDDREIIQALSIRLRFAGYDVMKAYDGEAGLDAARELNPDVVILDVRMPRMDGLTMLSKLRSSEHLSSLPAIVLSANVAERVRTEALELDACFFLSKPYEADVLLMAIRSALEQGIEGAGPRPTIN